MQPVQHPSDRLTPGGSVADTQHPMPGSATWHTSMHPDMSEPKLARASAETSARPLAEKSAPAWGRWSVQPTARPWVQRLVLNWAPTYPHFLPKSSGKSLAQHQEKLLGQKSEPHLAHQLEQESA
jgi:hypothetical protein